MILLATNVLDGRDDQRSFGVLDIDVRRNAFGRQVDSFEADLDVQGLVGGPMHAVFIRAPRWSAPGRTSKCWPRSTVRPVLVRQGPVMASAFHPELSDDTRLHELFLVDGRGVGMSGHSKWATIKHKKGAADKARAKLFAKLIRQVEVAAREGGSDLDANATLAHDVPEGAGLVGTARHDRAGHQARFR